MINFRIICKIIGSLLFIEAFFMTWCAAIAFYFHEEDQIAFLMSLLITFGSGFLFLLWGRNAENMLSRKDAFLLVTAVWVIFSLFGTFPFLIHGSITNFTDAYFETMSGFTTTGATIIDDVEVLPHGILFWRSLMQWIGGLGIVFFTIAILPSLVGGSVKVFAAEATGPVKAKMHPRLTTTAKWIWSIYLLLTIGCGIAFWLAGMNWFDATNYSMTTTATGGFSIHNDSLAFFHDPTIDYIAIVFQFLAGINFTLLYASIFKAKFADLFKNSEFKFYISILLLSTAGIATVLMFIGGCAGSTSGGFKCIRAVMTLKSLRNNFRQILHPNAVLPVRINGQSVPQARMVALFAFFTLFILMILVTAGIMLLSNIDMINSIVIALSCVSNIGPSLSTDIGANISWSGMPDFVKWTLCPLMLMGRLEIMTVLVLFTRSYWKEN